MWGATRDSERDEMVDAVHDVERWSVDAAEEEDASGEAPARAEHASMDILRIRCVPGGARSGVDFHPCSYHRTRANEISQSISSYMTTDGTIANTVGPSSCTYVFQAMQHKYVCK